MGHDNKIETLEEMMKNIPQLEHVSAEELINDFLETISKYIESS